MTIFKFVDKFRAAPCKYLLEITLDKDLKMEALKFCFDKLFEHNKLKYAYLKNEVESAFKELWQPASSTDCICKQIQALWKRNLVYFSKSMNKIDIEFTASFEFSTQHIRNYSKSFKISFSLIDAFNKTRFAY